MGSLYTSLLNSANQMRVYGRAFQVIQSNITNVNTPGYVKQIPNMATGGGDQLPGSVLERMQLSARDGFLEQAVRHQQQALGSAAQRASELGLVEAHFDPASQFGIPVALNNFFNGFSALAVNPNSLQARQSVLELAGAAADSFNQTARRLQEIATNARWQTQAAVDGVNRLAERIAGINRQYRANAAVQQDAQLDAQLHAALEELAQVVDFTLIRTPDGGANIYLGGGQTVLVVGDRFHPVTADLSGPETVIRDPAGGDITGQIRSGKLGGLLTVQNTLLPSYLDDLDTLAESFATAVNSILAQGVDRNGLPPPADLFAFDAGAGAAATLRTNGLTPEQIAAALPTAPGGNGNALELARLGSQPAVHGVTFHEFFGQLSARIGRDVAAARQQQIQFEDTLAQARQQRAFVSGVSLDEEAARLIQFQQAYQAMGKLVSVLNELTQVVLGILD
jgi:flagellar hook-associated protein 1 FlgK